MVALAHPPCEVSWTWAGEDVFVLNVDVDGSDQTNPGLGCFGGGLFEAMMVTLFSTFIAWWVSPMFSMLRLWPCYTNWSYSGLMASEKWHVTLIPCTLFLLCIILLLCITFITMSLRLSKQPCVAIESAAFTTSYNRGMILSIVLLKRELVCRTSLFFCVSLLRFCCFYSLQTS